MCPAERLVFFSRLCSWPHCASVRTAPLHKPEWIGGADEFSFSLSVAVHYLPPPPPPPRLFVTCSSIIPKGMEHMTITCCAPHIGRVVQPKTTPHVWPQHSRGYALISGA